MLKKTVDLIGSKGYSIGNIDATICAERPKLKTHIPAMQQTLSAVLGIDEDDVSVKATTTEKLGFYRTGRGNIGLCNCLDSQRINDSESKSENTMKQFALTPLYGTAVRNVLPGADKALEIR